MAGAILKAAGDLTGGVQVKGAVKMYQQDGVNDAAATAESIGPYDSGTILGTTPPGNAGIKLIDGTIQRAEAALLSDSTAGKVGNALVSDYDSTAGHANPTPPTGSTAAAGLSLGPQQE